MQAFRGMEPRESLDHFHQRCVVPEKIETASRNEEIDAFVRFLQAKFQNPPYTPARVLKGGSLGKGTAVRGLADIDLVVILNGLSSISDLKSHRPSLLDIMEREVSRYPWKRGIQKDKRTIYSVSYILNGQQLDVLPAFDIYSAYGTKEEVYSEMKGSEMLAMQFSASLAPLQIEFVKPEDEAVKRVIRLLKFWKNERGVDIRSYTLELLTIHASRNSRGWNTDSLFRDVLELLANCRTLKVAFNTNYNSSGYTGRLWAPYVLDPANPYMNTMYGNDPNTISAEASSMLRRL